MHTLKTHLILFCISFVVIIVGAFAGYPMILIGLSIIFYSVWDVSNLNSIRKREREIFKQSAEENYMNYRTSVAQASGEYNNDWGVLPMSSKPTPTQRVSNLQDALDRRLRNDRSDIEERLEGIKRQIKRMQLPKK